MFQFQQISPKFCKFFKKEICFFFMKKIRKIFFIKTVLFSLHFAKSIEQILIEDLKFLFVITKHNKKKRKTCTFNQF